MMSTATRRLLADATAQAEAFRALFPVECYEVWTIAGSIRRKSTDIGDCEHVVQPRMGSVPGNDLFATPEAVSLLWHHLDALVADGTVEKKIYGTTGFRWGERYRGATYQDCAHEIWTAGADAYGAQLAIRTGPSDYSRRLVINLRTQGRRNFEGSVWSCASCACDGKDNLCRDCQGDGLRLLEKIAVRNEAHYFELCGMTYVPPEMRV